MLNIILNIKPGNITKKMQNDFSSLEKKNIKSATNEQ